MKNISELFNLLSSKPSEVPGLLGGKGPFAPKGQQSGNGSFEDVLSRLASQTGNAPNTPSSSVTPATTPNQGELSAKPGSVGPAETVTTISETTISITESVKASNPEQLAQAEQTLASLAVGLAHLLQLMSQLNQGDTEQAQATLKSLGLGPQALSSIQNLLSGLQAFLQKLPPQQNPLNLPPDQQTALLGQLFQQMIQNQQLFLAVTPAAQTGASANPSASGGGNPQTAILQVDFSQIQADQLQEGNGQASQVFINLENFKMSATFIQEGQPSQLPGASQNPQDLLNALNQALAKLNPFSNPAVTSTGSALNSSAQNDLNQNFKNLVQLLMQSGVSQAALTSFMRHPQEAGNLNTLSAQAAAGSTSAANQTPRPALEIPPVMPTEATVETANNANTAQSQQPTGNGRVPQSANLAEPSITPNPSVIAGALKPLEVAGQNQATQAQGKENRVSPLSSGSAPTQTPAFIPLPETSTVNNTVDRLNAMAAQALITGPQRPVENSLSTPHGNVVQIQPQVPPANAPGAPAFNPPVAKGLPQNQVPGNAAQVQPSASARPIVPEQNVLNPREIAILNDTVVRMNASSLHTIQGSIGGNNTTPEINLTGGQILSSKFATDLLNPLPPTFGNPSVPITAPPPARQTPALNTAVEAAAGTPSEFQNLQNTAAPAVLSNAAQGGAVFSGPGINVSTPVQEPINQAAPLTSQAVSALPPVNPTSPLNNGASSSVSTAGSNNFNTPPGGVASTSNPAVTSNPAPAPTPGPNNVVVPLPQPATLPVGANPSTAQTAVAATTPALTPIALNQIILPPPTSPAPIVPATAAVGEGVKGEIPATTVPRNENFANPSAVASAQPMSSVIPVSPEAVAPAGGVLATATGLGIQNVLDKNAPNNSVILEANALLGFSNAANLAAGNTHTSSPAVISAAPGGNFNAVNLLSQISQQVSTQAAQAGSISHLSFQLMPESLGHLTVQVVLVDQSVSARIVVTNPEVRDTLQAHMVDLKSALNQAGLHIDQLQVQVQGGGGGNLLAQYYQYQQEGSGYRQPVPLAPTGTEGVLNLENTRDLAVSPSRMSLVDILA